MLKSGDVLDAPRLGLRFEMRRTAADTGGELTEFDAVGRPRGFVAQPHVHPRQTERLEVIEGTMNFTMNGQTRVLGPGEWVETPPGTAAPARRGRGRPGPCPHHRAPVRPRRGVHRRVSRGWTATAR